jgi:WD40-like Beta Propeller Repeat
MKTIIWLFIVPGGVAACGSVEHPPSAEPDAEPEVDVPPAARCDPLATFDAPVAVPGLAAAWTPSFTPDELTAYFFAPRLPGDLYVARRASRDQPFGQRARLGFSNPDLHETEPDISADELTLWFHAAPNGYRKIFVTTRISTLASFGTPALATINSATATDNDSSVAVSADGKELIFQSSRAGTAGNFDLWSADRVGSTFGTPRHLDAVASVSADVEATLSFDRLTLYFSRDDMHGYRSRRASTTTPWEAPVRVPELDGNWHFGWLSEDDCRLYVSNRTTGDVQVYTRQP